ncbi:hypothetical protein GJ496_007844 [Pomphorhynchus laevis]|nr:hypothetical protein GJ496_007844 [Pomphorhynchus laevis]
MFIVNKKGKKNISSRKENNKTLYQGPQITVKPRFPGGKSWLYCKPRLGVVRNNTTSNLRGGGKIAAKGIDLCSSNRNKDDKRIHPRRDIRTSG